METNVIFPNDIPSAVTDREAVRLARLARDGVVLELGSHYGYSTVCMAQTAERVHSVDWHRGDPDAGQTPSLSTFLKNLGRYQVADKVVVHVGRFEDVLPYLGKLTFDGCFLDGSHDFASVYADTTAAYRLVVPGGWLAWHDWGRFDVTRAVRMLGLSVEVAGALAWHRKTEAEEVAPCRSAMSLRSSPAPLSPSA